MHTPNWKKKDLEWINKFRAEYDELYSEVIDAHFTIVFPTDYESDMMMIDDVEEILSGVTAFDFEIKCALINKDSFNDYWHVFFNTR